MEEWKEYKISDVCKIRHGFAFKGAYFTNEKQPYICVTPGNFDIKGGFKLSKPKYYHGPIPNDYILNKDDLIVTMTDLSKDGDTLGYSAIIPQIRDITFLHNQRIGLVESIASNISKHFLYWVMRTPEYQKYIVNCCSGSTVKHTSPKLIGTYVFKAPDPETQEEIASLLNNLDAKIELNRRINDNLEQQAQALFKSWFVDFEPFLSKEFSKSDSLFGDIPVGWSIVSIKDLPIYITDYVANGSFASLKENVRLYDKPNYAHFIRNTDLKAESYKIYVDKHSYEFLSKSVLEGGEIIISNVGDVGSVFLCPKLQKPMTLGNNIILLRPKNNYSMFYLYMLFKGNVGQHLIDGITGGSAQRKFNKTDFKSIKIMMPPVDILIKFDRIIKPIFSKIEKNSEESSRLELVRDTLLPKLMSGEVEINKINN